jgi:hypothetical protein
MNIHKHISRISYFSIRQIELCDLYLNPYSGTRFYCRYWFLASHHRKAYRLSDWSYQNLPRYCGYQHGLLLIPLGQGVN